MVSRIESNGGNENWLFSRNVMPGEELRFIDLDPEKPIRMYSVVCKKDDSQTDVFEVQDPQYIDMGQEGENPIYTRLATLRLGDSCYEKEVYSPSLKQTVVVRISHTDRI